MSGLKRWICQVRPSGRKYSVSAATETEALWLLVHEHSIDPRKINSLLQEEIVEVNLLPKKPEMTFVVTVGKRDYFVPASNELEALRELGLRGLDMSKARNVRKSD